MNEVRNQFSSFAVGDVATFRQRFTEEDFTSFVALSGDTNPLHVDPQYAATTPFGKPIVPFLMELAPLSRIAGMIFPGPPSLYLGLEAQALLPVYFGDDLTYSARIEAINTSHRVLTIRVLLIRGHDVVLAARQRVQVRDAEWVEPAGIDRQPANQRPWTLITGATGALGSAIARLLAQRNHDLLLHGRNASHLEKIAESCRRHGGQVATFVADLQSANDAANLAAWAAGHSGWTHVIHTASAGVHSDLDALVQVNYAAIRTIAHAFTHHALPRQYGTLAMVSSSAVDSHPAGWEDYVAAKRMGESIVAGFEHRFAQYGPRGIVVAPGYIRSSFSEGLVPNTATAMLPEEAADRIVTALFSDDEKHAYYTILHNGTRAKGTAFSSASTASPHAESVPSDAAQVSRPQHTPSMAANATNGAVPDSARLDSTVRSLLKLPSQHDLSDGGMGITPGWDSLRHVEILVAIEREFGVQFSSADISNTHRYDGIRDLLLTKSSHP